MAAAISVHNMLQRMGLSLEVATEVVNVNGQNLSVLEDFLRFKDKDAETLCRVIRRPGGVNATGNQNQGMQVLAMAEGKLKCMCYQLRHHTRVSRPVVWADITMLSVRALSAQAEMEASHRDPITLPVMDPKKLTSTLGDSEVTINPRSAMSIARTLFRPWQQLTPRLGQSGVCTSLMMTRCVQGAPSFWLGWQSALTRKLSGLSPRVSLSTGRRCGRSSPRFSSPTMPSRSSREQRRPEMVDWPNNCCTRTIWGQTTLDHGR